MRVDADTARKTIRTIWPSIGFIWMQDNFYILPTIEDMMEKVYASQVVHMRSDGELMDCDDYSLLLNASIKQQRIAMSDELPAEDNYHWAFGEAFGDKINRLENIHTLCICIAQEGVFLIEPQTYDFWQAVGANDNILIVKM